ncbi:MAG: TlyA family RNA methyltransferase [Chloroflexota bacterium]|nr:TlyA family RNA methyltransferase [Chloroflexota bacterium]MDE2946274.1 TlyA family RNA methyltransferase [Chloroflexota bacterium]
MSAARKTRLDLLLVERRLAPSRSKAAAMIMAGEVRVGRQLVDKPGTAVAVDADIALKEKAKYVGRGGLKLEAALNAFAVNAAGKVCADIGASTGGFTDCLLQRGAAKVYAIDVGRAQLDYRLRNDKRVANLENTNARYLETLDEAVEIVVIDVSFISLRLILPAVARIMGEPADVIALVKPQFEAGRASVGKGGIVRDAAVHRRVLNDVAAWAVSHGLAPVDLIRSPITGAKGNVEYLLWLQQGAGTRPPRGIHERIDELTTSKSIASPTPKASDAS